MPDRLASREEVNRDDLLAIIGKLVRFAVKTGTASKAEVARCVQDELDMAEPPNPNDPLSGMRFKFTFSADQSAPEDPPFR
jgi:hypothetical protein